MNMIDDTSTIYIYIYIYFLSGIEFYYNLIKMYICVEFIPEYLNTYPYPLTSQEFVLIK